MPHCIVKNCKNVATKVKKGDGVSYFVIPKDRKRNIAWRRFITISRGDKNCILNPFAVVCSDHFKEDDIVTTPKGIRRLKTTAVPTLQVTDVKKLRAIRHFNKKLDISNETAIITSIEDINKNETFVKTQIMDTSSEVQNCVTMDGVVQGLSATDGATKPSSQEAGQHSVESVSKNDIGNIVNEVFNFETRKLSDMDKFKRRLIRSIARSLFVEKVPEDEMWAQLRKDTDCDCYMLWKRMRSLTLKKLRRLLAVEDRWENMTKVARLSVTDWLLFDLVLVHEKVDLIGQENMTEHSKEPAVLHELFELVNKHKVEMLEGDQLIRAWMLLTMEYNKRGRQCSPMLLQRRWYQMKQLARIKFYNFWFAYGGAASKLEKAWQQKPTELQAEIAKRYRWIVINEFPSWEELVIKKKVILRENFENLSLEDPVNQKAPDVLIIETPVETIHIDEDSDADDDGKSKKQSDALPVPDVVSKPKVENLEICIDNIKSEAKEPELDSYGSADVQILEDMHIPVEQNKLQDSQKNSEFESSLINAGNIQGECLDEVLPKITSVTGGVELLDSDEDCDDALITLPQQVESIESNSNVITQNAAQSHSDIPEDISGSTTITSSMISIKQDKKADENQDYEVQLDDLVILDDGIELEDDGIELLEEDGTEDLMISMNTKPIINDQEENKIDEISKFDYKLLLTPVVYTKKLDDMDVFKFIDYNKVRDVRIIECSFIESKTVKIKKENTEVKKDISEQSHLDKKDSVKPESIENAYEKRYNTSEYVNESQRVKYSSWLLQKPKNRSYNPIQLCKNPDFNTRLKRLTAGFLSCENNRLLLSKCKKMTIDLHKSFETKLIEGKIYLQSSKFNNAEKNYPSMQAQPDAVKVSISNIVPIISSLTTNETVIKSEILQVDNNGVKKIADTCKRNDKLLTVEVTPMKDNINYYPPVEIVADLSAKQLEQGQEILNQVQGPNKLKDCETSKVSIEVNVDDPQLKDNENAEMVDLEPGNNSINRRINKHKFQNLLGKTLINGPKNYRFGYSLSTPERAPVPWNAAPKYSKNTSENDMFDGVLLASDTLEKMFQLLSNQTIDDKKKKKKKSKLMQMELAKNNGAGEEVLRGKEDKNSEINSEIETKLSKPTENNQNLNAGSETSPIAKIVSKKRCRPKIVLPSTSLSHLKSSRYCCWALEKLLTNKIPKEPHYCPRPICICCCRDRLLEKSMRDKQGRNTQRKKGALAQKEKIQTTENNTQKSIPQNKKIIVTLSREQKDNPILGTPIVLSDDDEDDKNKTCQNFEIDTNKRCQSGAKNMMSNSEENINEASHKTVDVPNSVSEISTSHGLEISIPDMSVVKQITLNSPSKDNKNNLPCKARGRPMPKISVSSRSTLDQLGLQKKLPQNEPNKGNNQLIIDSTDPSFENNSKYLHPSSAKLIEILSSPPKMIRDCVTSSGTDIYLNKSVFSDSFPTDINNPSKMPIFLGKNKILLCSNNSLTGSPIQADSITTEEGQSILPPGVQIVLLPSGELALSIEPGVNFTPDAISKLSEILKALQQQLNVSGVETDKEKSLEPLNIEGIGNNIYLGNTDTTNTSESDKNILVTQANQNKSECIPSIEIQNTTSSEVEAINLETESLTDVLGEVKEKSSGTQSEIVNETHIDDQTSDNSVDSAAQPNKKSILFDLMEMSGISENDAICDDKIQIKSHEKLSASLNSFTSEAIARKDPIKVMCNDQIMPSVDILEQPVVYKALEKRKELSIVSSFAELKDCHENHCQFYKMDTETGQILPINLKIKKGVRFQKRRRNVQQLIDPDSIIDLTDDKVIITTEETKPTKPVGSQNTTSGSNIKPINLIRSIRSIGSNPKKEIISLELLKTNSNTESTLVSILKQKKSLLISNQISDLNNTATNENNLSNDNNNETQDQDSDSDDEPLAQKAMRKRESDVTVSDLHAVSPKILHIEQNFNSEPTEFSSPEFLEQDNHESNDEDSDENCILGV